MVRDWGYLLTLCFGTRIQFQEAGKSRRNSGHCGLFYHFLHDYDRNDGRVDVWLEIYGLSLSRGDVGYVVHYHYL